MKANTRLIFYICIMSIGGAVIGIDLGLIATTLAQTAFNTFMFPPGTANESSLIGAIVSMGSVGNVFGCLSNGFILEKFGRRYTLLFSTFFTIIGAILQSGANGWAMMIVGRFVCGFALGILNPTIPIYISELSRPHERARLVGIFGMMVAVGFCLANWIGYACSFAKGNGSWRIALGMMIPLAVALMAFSLYLPESPRWCK
jgi:MFS family permease